jgi:hypothetical protein
MELRTWVCWTVHQTLSGAPGPYRPKPTILGNSKDSLRYNSLDCPVSQRSNDSLRANGRFVRWIVMNNVVQKSEVTGLSNVAPDCPVQQDDKALQRSTAPNPNERADVARTGQWTVNVWCANRQQRLGSGWRL